MKNLLALLLFCAGFSSVLLGCTEDITTDYQLTTSGYHVESNVSCISVCNSYNPSVFLFAFFFENQLCFCSNASLPQLNIFTNNTCFENTCLNGNSSTDCIFSYQVFPLTLGIIERNIIFSPKIAVVDNEVQIQTNVVKGGASSAYVIPIPNDLPPLVQTVKGMTVNTHFYLPGLHKWTQTIGNSYADPFNTTSWLQVNEGVGGVNIIPSTDMVNGVYNFFLTITKGTNLNVNIMLPMNENLNFTTDIMRLSFGYDLASLYTSQATSCSLEPGFVLKQVVLTSGYLTKLKLNVFAKGTLEVAILRPKSSSFFKVSLVNQSQMLNTPKIVTALVVKQFLFLLNAIGVFEISFNSKNSEVQENDMIWIGGTASLICDRTDNEPMSGIQLGKTITFSTDAPNNGFFISFFISKPFEYLIPINTVGLFNLLANVSDYVPSFQIVNYSFPIQIPVSGLRFAENYPIQKNVAGYKPKSLLLLKAVIQSGSDVSYLFDIPKLNYSANISNGDTVNFTMTTLGFFTVYLTAANRFNSISTSIDIAVLSEINGLFLNVVKEQLQNSSYNTTVSLFNGTEVQLMIDFGDGTPPTVLTNIIGTGVNGYTYIINHTYSACKVYTITTYAANVLVYLNETVYSSYSNSSNVTVFCLMSPLKVKTIPYPSLYIVDKKQYVKLSFKKPFILNIYQDKGSYRNYSIDWGDGTYSYYNQSVMNLNEYSPVSFQLIHLYEKESIYNLIVNSSNALQTLSFSNYIDVNECSVPDVSFYYGTISDPVTVVRSISNDFTAIVDSVRQTCKIEKFSFQWNLSSSISPINSTEGILSQQKVTYTISKNFLDFGIYYLNLRYTYGYDYYDYIAYLNVTFLPLSMSIKNGLYAPYAYKIKDENNTIFQNFTISATSSYDPDNQESGIQNITFTWSCKVASDFLEASYVMENFTKLNMNFSSDTCFNQTWMDISSNSLKMNFSTQQFLEGINYHIKVCGTKVAGKDIYLNELIKTNCFVQEILIVKQNVPVIALKCISNCDEKLNFKERFIYSFICTDCGFQRLAAKWTITNDSGVVPSEILSETATTTGFLTPSLVINKDILLESTNYTFTLVVGFEGSVYKAKFKFTRTTCTAPTSGICYVDPKEGVALKTKFGIFCNNWKDSDGLLNYMFFYDNGQSQRMNLTSTTTTDYPILNAASTDKPNLIDFVLGPGDKNNDLIIKIITQVSGKYKAYTESTHYIKVFPNEIPKNMTNLMTNVNLLDVQSVTNLAQAISSNANKNSVDFYNETENNVKNQHQLLDLQEIRKQVIGLLNNVSIKDLDSFKSVSDALVVTSQVPLELGLSAQKQAADIIDKLAILFTKDNFKGIGADHYDIMTQSFVNSISNLFQAGLNNNKTEIVLSANQTTVTTTAATTPSNLSELDYYNTTFLVTKCKCTHLTAFGGFFVSPNPLPKLSISKIKTGYTLLISVVIIIMLWIIGLLLARRIDKHDALKVGVCPLLDNLPEDKYLYEIVVNTGNRRNAGTKSNIFFTVTGDVTDSGVRHLKDPERECFQRSSCDVFIMTTPRTLGDLDFIRIWHDNSGGGWYIKNIVITDLQTEKKYLFIFQRWIAVDCSSSLDCVIPVASNEESTNFTYVFQTKAHNKFLDEHLWFSIFARPPKSNFTRCQRLSVAVSLIMTSMMISTLFYQRVPPAKPAIENQFGNFTFTYSTVFLLLVSSLAKLPVQLLIIKIFRLKLKHFKYVKDNSNSFLESSKIKEKKKAYTLYRLQDVSNVSFDEQQNTHSKKPHLFNWYLYIGWFICVGNIFVCSFIVFLYGTEFGNAKSLTWLSSVTIDFVKDIFVIEPMKIFVLAVIVALVVKKVNEDTIEVENEGKVLAHDEVWLHKMKHESENLKKENLKSQPLDSMTLNKMRELGLKHKKINALIIELTMYTLYATLVFFIGYKTREGIAFFQTRNVGELFNLQLRPGVSYNESTVFNQIQSSKDFWPWMEKFFLPKVYPDPWYNLSKLYANTDKKDFPGKVFLNDLTSKIVNGIRIRQIRVQSNSCIKPNLVAEYIKIDCLSQFFSASEETRDFHLNWSSKLNSTKDSLKTPWSYQTWQELDGYPYAADLDTYYGGGYVIEIFPKWKNKELLEQVKDSRWIDRQTRAVIIEFALFNAVTNYFNMVIMVLEFPASGGVVPNFSIITFNLYSSTKVLGITMMVSQILFILMMLVITVRECRFLYRAGRMYFLEFWNLVEAAIIILSYIAVGFFFYKEYLGKSLLKRLSTKKPQIFINFQFASYWDLTYINIVALIVFFVTLKFIKLLRFNRRISMLSSTLKAGWYPLSMFGIIVLIILCSFIFSCNIMFGAFIDGYQTYFKTIASIISLLLGKFSYSHFGKANPVLGPIFFLTFNIIVIWIVINMFVSILNDVFEAVRTSLETQSNDFEMVDFILEHFKDLLGFRPIKKEDMDKEADMAYQNKIVPTSLNSLITPSVTSVRKLKKKFSDRYKVKKERFRAVEINDNLKLTVIQQNFSKYDYLLNDNEVDSNESLNKFIACTSLLYKSSLANEKIHVSKNDERRMINVKTDFEDDECSIESIEIS
ncbi:uncharacterized protein LOC101238025 isoform X2 [Hydra vulgaris]|uniref:uncharacterized protein LOC101238025 isoform X2 n=1 Tax=Hydra vulgaris TaxID=6087 RepID=UPI001F5F4B33|nr:uncharacterized protein LOC101238025 isoform X2 [Hydra vulgaris]